LLMKREGFLKDGNIFSLCITFCPPVWFKPWWHQKDEVLARMHWLICYALYRLFKLVTFYMDNCLYWSPHSH
jgi:hypothetical protein